MNYCHWAANPVKLHRQDYPQSGHPKPNGLWFDIDEDWKRWCEAAQFNLEGLRYRHTVTVLDSSRMLFLQKAREIDSFTKRYGRNLSCNVQLLQRSEDLGSIAQDKGRSFFNDIQKAFSSYILWDEVAEKYSGIIIAPYSRSRSQAYLWYWGWNCAAGCVWDTSVIRLGEPCNMFE
jgi:hypothetical protein